MFQEFVNRSGFDATGLTPVDSSSAPGVVIGLGAAVPAAVLRVRARRRGPDRLRAARASCAAAGELHPLLERIMRIHVTEEARHLSFARHYLKRTCRRSGAIRRAELAIGAPVVLSVMAQMMLRPSRQIVRRYEIPSSVITEAFTKNANHHAEALASMGKLRRLWVELGLTGGVFGRLWRVLGLWADETRRAASVGMTASNMARLEQIVSRLPESKRVDIEAWGGEPTFRVNGKNFVFCDESAGHLTVKLSREEAAAVVATDPARRAVRLRPRTPWLDLGRVGRSCDRRSVDAG